MLYVGKAKSLKNRLKNYIQADRLVPKIKQMVSLAQTVKFELLASDLEAILIEAELIRLHQPTYNTLLKDDKTPLYIHITDELFPRVLTLRKKEVDTFKQKGTILGPFPSGYKVKEVLRIVRPIFPWCNQRGNQAQIPAQTKPCFYQHLDLCAGACINIITADEYQGMIKQLILFLRGQKKTVLRELKQQLRSAVKTERFEEAARLRDRIQLIEAVTQKSYQLHPTLVLPDLTSNKREQALLQLRKVLVAYLHLPKTIPLTRIEGFDVSNISGTHPAVSQVTFIDCQPASSEYRLYNIRSLQTPNDFQMLKEALTRRQNHPEWGIPDLIVIDGGKGQVRGVLSIWQWPTPVIGIAKKPDRLIIPILEPQSKQPIDYHIIALPDDHPALHLIQYIRNESHRFSKKQHHRLRLKSMFA